MSAVLRVQEYLPCNQHLLEQMRLAVNALKSLDYRRVPVAGVSIGHRQATLQLLKAPPDDMGTGRHEVSLQNHHGESVRVVRATFRECLLEWPA